MSFATYLQVKTAVEQELDLEDEDFIRPTEMMAYCNQAIHQAESIITKIHEDYFLSSTTLAMVSGTSSYSLPSDIFAHKIRAVTYANGSDKYTIPRLRRSDMFDLIPNIDTSEDYRYLITNSLADGVKFNLYPAARDTGSYITIWYIRNAKTVTATTDTVDIPEFRAFVEKYMIMKCLMKEGHPSLAAAATVFEDEKKLMIDTLTERFADNDNAVEQDLSHYLEHN